MFHVSIVLFPQLKYNGCHGDEIKMGMLSPLSLRSAIRSEQEKAKLLLEVIILYEYIINTQSLHTITYGKKFQYLTNYNGIQIVAPIWLHTSWASDSNKSMKYDRLKKIALFRSNEPIQNRINQMR